MFLFEGRVSKFSEGYDALGRKATMSMQSQEVLLYGSIEFWVPWGRDATSTEVLGGTAAVVCCGLGVPRLEVAPPIVWTERRERDCCGMQGS